LVASPRKKETSSCLAKEKVAALVRDIEMISEEGLRQVIAHPEKQLEI